MKNQLTTILMANWSLPVSILSPHIQNTPTEDFPHSIFLLIKVITRY